MNGKSFDWWDTEPDPMILLKIINKIFMTYVVILIAWQVYLFNNNTKKLELFDDGKMLPGAFKKIFLKVEVEAEVGTEWIWKR